MLAALLLALVAHAADPGPVAVVELFTSEGCSSCPPAEAVLAEFAQDAAKDGVPITALALHVTYWDRLGWVDPFGLPAADARQSLYGEVVSEGRLYTPMMVVNGQRHFVGSNRPLARAEVMRALLEPAAAVLSPTVTRGAQGQVDVALAVETSEPGPLVAQAALVQPAAETAVPRGENAGRTLAHVRVVRALEVAPVTDGAARLQLTPPNDAKGLLLVTWVQRADDLRVVGVAEQPVPRAATRRRRPRG